MIDPFSDDYPFTPYEPGETTLDQARELNEAAARLYVQELRPEMDVITYENEDCGRLDFQ